jgi:hypothetical protein
MTTSGLRREDATHLNIPSRTSKPKDEFPKLGALAPKKVPTLNFKAMATEASVRFARQEAEAAAEEIRRKEEQERMARYVSHAELLNRRRLASIPTHCYDDGPDDYDPPEEDDLDADAYGFAESYEFRGYDYEEPTPEKEEDDQYNANLFVDRRAGDKSNW